MTPRETLRCTVGFLSFVLLAGCGGAQATSTTTTDRATEPAPPAVDATPDTRAMLPPPVPIETLSGALTEAWQRAAALDAAAEPAVWSAARATDCSANVSDWHARVDESLRAIDGLVGELAAHDEAAERAPALAIRGLAHLVAFETTDLLGGLPACTFARDAQESEPPGDEGSDAVQVARLQARAVRSDAWRAVAVRDLNHCAYDAGTHPAWAAACATWLGAGAPALGDLEPDTDQLRRTLLARDRASNDGTCVRLRVFWISPAPDGDEARASARALVEARAARAHLASGRGWRSLLLLLRDGTLVPATSRAPEGDEEEGEEEDEDEDEDEEAIEPVEREILRSDPADTDPVAIAARAEPGSAPRILAEPIEAHGSFAVVERIAVFTPPDHCGS
jgi:hypothetical protein